MSQLISNCEAIIISSTGLSRKAIMQIVIQGGPLRHPTQKINILPWLRNWKLPTGNKTWNRDHCLWALLILTSISLTFAKNDILHCDIKLILQFKTSIVNCKYQWHWQQSRHWTNKHKWLTCLYGWIHVYWGVPALGQFIKRRFNALYTFYANFDMQNNVMSLASIDTKWVQ